MKIGVLRISLFIFALIFLKSSVLAEGSNSTEEDYGEEYYGEEDYGEEDDMMVGLPPDNMLDELVYVYRNSSERWIEPIKKAALNLFYYLMVLDFTYSAILLVLQNSELQQYIVEIIKRIIFFGFFMALLKFGPYWAHAIVESFEKLGREISYCQCASASSASDVFESGIKITSKMMSNAKLLTGELFLVALIAVVVMVCLSLVAGMMVITTVEMHIVLSASIILLGFGASRWTNEYAKNYLRYALAVGLKLFALLLVVDIGFEIILYWENNFSGSKLEQSLMLMGGTIVYLTLVWTIPGILASLANSTSPSTSDNLMRTTSLVSSLSRTGALIGQAGKKAGIGSAGAYALGKNSYMAAKAQGSSGFSTVKGAVSHAASALKNTASNSFSSSVRNSALGKAAERIKKAHRY